MIDKELLQQTVSEAIADMDIFIVDIRVSKDNDIVVEIDSPQSIDITTCERITRAIEARFDRDEEDYALEVGSAGLTAPFKVRGQYLKNVGNEIEILTCDGRKLSGTLVRVDEDGTFAVSVPHKVKPEGAKRPVIQEIEETFRPEECKKVNYLINFK